MPVGLAGARGGTTVEEPQPTGVTGQERDPAPVVRRKPAGLRLPGIRDQEQMARLDWIFVEQHHMAAAEPFHFKGLLPWQEGIGLGATSA